MNEIYLKRENDRLRRESSELKEKIAGLEARLPKQAEVIKPTVEKPKFDPLNRCPNDPVFNALRQQQPRRRSWLNE